MDPSEIPKAGFSSARFNTVCETDAMPVLLEGIDATDGGHTSSTRMQTLQTRRLTLHRGLPFCVAHTCILPVIPFSGASSPVGFHCASLTGMKGYTHNRSKAVLSVGWHLLAGRADVLDGGLQIIHIRGDVSLIHYSYRNRKEEH